LADVIVECQKRGLRASKTVYGSIASLEYVIKEGARRFACFPTLLQQPVLALLASWTKELQQCSTLIEQRRGEGFIRHCHGELHLANICLVQGRPTLFDALEFRDSFAVIDVMFDIAFVLMDLEKVGLRSFAGILLSRYAVRLAII
jgi:aminoglycoside phosphotransferase family enzyme